MILLDLRENLFASSLCIALAELWPCCHEGLKLLGIWNMLGTFGGKCHEVWGFISVPHLGHIVKFQ